ncbi:PocR ligand-binding domain-containing protein [Anaerocolumna sp. MB42-C2]|uniref:PocR ligand-binding domain-containing protein n=1 Tax=Anaerocolumna sp. MB42-C2 TaxID=3070997 RepID=UPI0027E1E68D|nr:PocR ligand-binding domain-containing protein [Anaerocolumna sp. MB42-C2]WMJ85787.1 PocR ligand-binding domain-containing protein [Anaerocolumna sp. MB42-C2]
MEEQINLFSVLKELHTISGFRISVYDTEQHEICAYPKELGYFCTCIQKSNEGRNSCLEYDCKAFEEVRKTGQAYIYQCRFGLYEAVSPLYHYGVLSGYLMMGQTIDNGLESADSVYSKSLTCITDKERLKEAIRHIPISSKDKILSCISIMKICASYITFHNGWKPTDKDLSSRIKKYLNRNYAAKITLEDLCKEFYCSKTTLTSAFKANYGISVVDYLTGIRIDQAKALLKNDSLSMKIIAQTCGFSDQNYFTKVFLKHCGVTPSGYRNSLH